MPDRDLLADLRETSKPAPLPDLEAAALAAAAAAIGANPDDAIAAEISQGAGYGLSVDGTIADVLTPALAAARPALAALALREYADHLDAEAQHPLTGAGIRFELAVAAGWARSRSTTVLKETHQ